VRRGIGARTPFGIVWRWSMSRGGRRHVSEVRGIPRNLAQRRTGGRLAAEPKDAVNHVEANNFCR
jgi:hypothetical protein